MWFLFRRTNPWICGAWASIIGPVNSYLLTAAMDPGLFRCCECSKKKDMASAVLEFFFGGWKRQEIDKNKYRSQTVSNVRKLRRNLGSRDLASYRISLGRENQGWMRCFAEQSLCCSNGENPMGPIVESLGSDSKTLSSRLHICAVACMHLHSCIHTLHMHTCITRVKRNKCSFRAEWSGLCCCMI